MKKLHPLPSIKSTVTHTSTFGIIFLYFVVQTLRVTSDKPHPKEDDKLHLNVVLGFPHLVSVCWCERRLHHPRSGSLCSGSEVWLVPEPLEPLAALPRVLDL